jgi:hypothetical protein
MVAGPAAWRVSWQWPRPSAGRLTFDEHELFQGDVKGIMDAFNHRPAEPDLAVPQQPAILLRHAELPSKGVERLYPMLM